MFRTDYQTILNWLNAKGYGVSTGSKRDAMSKYLKIKTGGNPTGSPADLLHLRLGQLGFTGGLQDRLNTFFKQKTGAVNPAEAERLFFQNNSADFT